MTTWRAQRDYWLDHYYQRAPGRRPNGKTEVTAADYIAVPPPPDLVAGVKRFSKERVAACSVWKWGLATKGYGNIDKRPAHVRAFEQSVRRVKDVDEAVFHLCRRPFCVQPAHLYAATGKEELRTRRRAQVTPSLVEDRLRAMLKVKAWPVVQADVQLPLIEAPALPCAHDFSIVLGPGFLCRNCHERQAATARMMGAHRDSCQEHVAFRETPCRCRTSPCGCSICQRGGKPPRDGMTLNQRALLVFYKAVDQGASNELKEAA